ncbi:unnamed protein product [Brassica napus]|uniref:(rape) hypothetical protein n=1 Tax=Brassica napus TaxID=3708 RepID=A0A816J235_BRANA|nr:unnamed protein product [Brassica napus]
MYPQGRISHHFGRCVLETILLLRDQSLSGRGSIRERAVREVAAAFKSFSRLARKIKLAYTMLTLPAWNSLNLTINYFSSKYAHHSGVSPSLPPHMKVQAQYVMVLCSFKEQLQQHVRVHAVEAVMACREIENNLHSLTGATLGEGSGATMSEDEDDLQMDFSSDNSGVDFSGGHDMTGFGPLLPTESERSLMERVRQELKLELKQGFKSRIEDVREEIMRKRRAGKLPGDTTTVLKNWWQQHCKWPYPTEDDKAKLVEETGLQLKQINNWFINQRKRNWHNNSHSLTSLKSKRKQ